MRFHEKQEIAINVKPVLRKFILSNSYSSQNPKNRRRLERYDVFHKKFGLGAIRGKCVRCKASLSFFI
jgi:hypothetical protein